MTATLAACLIVRDEAARLPACLASLSGVDRIVVIDTGSTDDTVAVARSLGATVGFFPWADDFAAARNAALSTTDADWVLMIDADERLGDGGVAAIRAAIVADAEATVILAPIVINAGDDAVGGSLHRVSRLFARRPGRHYRGRIHEALCEADGTPVPVQPVEGWVIHHDGYTAAARASRRKGERNLRLLSRWVDEAPDDVQAAHALGQELASYGRHYEAVVCFQRALQGTLAAADQELACLQMMLSFSELGDVASVLAAAETWKPLGERFPDYWLVVGYAHVRRQETDEARACFERALAFAAASPVVLETAGARTWKPRAYLAQVALMEMDAPTAWQEAKSLLAEAGDQLIVQVLAVRAAMAMGDDEAALAVCRQALDRWPVSDKLGDILAGALDEFGARGQRLLEPFIEWPGGFFAVVRRLASAGQWELILTLCERWTERLGAAAYAMAGMALLEQGQYPEALDAFDSACALEPEVWEHWGQLADTARLMGDRETASAAYREAHLRHPGALSPLLGLCDLAALAGNLEQSAAWLVQANQVAPQHPEVQSRLARMAAMTGA
jgi:tetratricopeptide (TPR) repeat protein